MNERKKSTLLRRFIYSGGLFLVASVVLTSTTLPIKEYYVFNKDSFLTHNVVSVISNEDLVEFEILIEPKEDFDFSEIEVHATKTLEPMLIHRRNMLTETQQVKNRLFENNHSKYPNGSILKSNRVLYFIEKGKLRPFQSITTFKEMGFDKKNIISVNKEILNTLEIGDNLNFRKKDKIYPSGLIVKAGNDYFITGSNNLYPLFSENLISRVWKNFAFIETNSIKKKDTKNIPCLLFPEDKQVVCNGKLERDKLDLAGNSYSIFVYGIPENSISSITINLTKKPTTKQALRKLKKMIW
ncbi:MAG: hypothetical protein U9O20_00485 [Patescibacteria group bacterium]|nr:hypothetical protein [Patescibacteria group bacterium]